MSEQENEKPVSPMTKAQKKFLDAAVAIGLDPPTGRDSVYIASQLVQCTLPHRDPGDVPLWTRKNGNLTLAIQPGMNVRTGKSFGYPYGTIPRLVLFWITTQAIKQKGKKANPRRLELGSNLNLFLSQIGLSADTGGGKRSDAARLREQIQSLFRARISFDKSISQGVKRGGRIERVNGHQWLDMQIATKARLWWNDGAEDQDVFSESWIELGEEFFEAITVASVPVDIRALKALKRSPLALDLYAWLAHESFCAHKTRKGRFVSWTCLMQQLGSEYSSEKNFGAKARKALGKIQAVYPRLKLGSLVGGIEIAADSFPAIQPESADHQGAKALETLAATAPKHEGPEGQEPAPETGG